VRRRYAADSGQPRAMVAHDGCQSFISASVARRNCDRLVNVRLCDSATDVIQMRTSAVESHILGFVRRVRGFSVYMAAGVFLHKSLALAAHFYLL
jgi:hypothetical protein